MIPKPEQCPHCGSKYFSYSTYYLDADLSVGEETVDIDTVYTCDSCDEEFTLYAKFKLGSLISSEVSEQNP